MAQNIRWRQPRPRPEQRPTVNVAAVGFDFAVPRAHRHGPHDTSVELVPGIAFHAPPNILERLFNEGAAAARTLNTDGAA
jgi:hypothetical protein